MSASKTPTTTTTTVSSPAGPAPPQPRGRYVHLSGTVILHTPHLAPQPAALVTSGTASCRPCRGHRTKSTRCMVLLVVGLLVPFKSANTQRSSLIERAREVWEGTHARTHARTHTHTHAFKTVKDSSTNNNNKYNRSFQTVLFCFFLLFFSCILDHPKLES